MSDTPSADNLKAALRPVRAILDQLPEADAHAIIARKALDTVKDEALRSIETTPPACANHATTCTPVGAHSLPDPLRPR